MDNAGRDTISHIVRHCLNSDHETANIENFQILNIWYDNNSFRRTSEAFCIKQYRSSLNEQNNSVSLEFCNWFWLSVYSNVNFATFRILLYDQRNLSLRWWPLGSIGQIYRVKEKYILIYIYIYILIYINIFWHIHTNWSHWSWYKGNIAWKWSWVYQ